MHTLNTNNPMKVSNIKRKVKHYILIMVICGSYMFRFSVSKDTKKTMIKEEFQHILKYLLPLIVKKN